MIKENYEKIKKEVGDSAHIIAVTKYHSVEETLEAYEAGVRHFGENRVEGFIEKRKALPEDAEVHFIGTMQSRKVKDVIEDLNYLHSLERESVAKKIESSPTSWLPSKRSRSSMLVGDEGVTSTTWGAASTM